MAVNAFIRKSQTAIFEYYIKTATFEVLQYSLLKKRKPPICETATFEGSHFRGIPVFRHTQTPNDYEWKYTAKKHVFFIIQNTKSFHHYFEI